jgi:hypothetical protein
MPKLFRLIWFFLVSLGERGEVGDSERESTPDTGTETTETPAPDTGGDDFQSDTTPSDTPPAPADWRAEKYGADWQNSLDYQRDTVKYLRGELDKAKRKPQRRIEEAQPEVKPQTQDARPQTPSPYGDVQTVDEFGNRIESRFEQRLAEREQQSMFRMSMQETRAAEQGDPKRGIPSFSDLEQEVLIPAVEKQPAILHLLKTFPHPGKAAYTLAFLLKYNTLDALEKLFAGKAREELGDRINEVSREAVRPTGEGTAQPAGS